MNEFMMFFFACILLGLLLLPVLALMGVHTKLVDEFFGNENLRYPTYRAQIREIYAEKTAEKENE